MAISPSRIDLRGKKQSITKLNELKSPKRQTPAIKVKDLTTEKESIIDKILKSDRIGGRMRQIKHITRIDNHRRNLGCHSQAEIRKINSSNELQAMINIQAPDIKFPNPQRYQSSDMISLKSRPKKLKKTQVSPESNLICRFANCQSPNGVLYPLSPSINLAKSRRCVKSVGNLTMLFV